MADTLTDTGYTAASALATAAMTTVAMISTAAATAIAYKQYKLATEYYDMAREAQDYFNSTYKPLENAIVAEAENIPKYTPQYDTTAGRYVAVAKQQFKRAFENIGIHAGRYCTGLTASLMRDATVAQSMAINDAINLAYRYEDGRQQIFDDRRWQRRMQAASLGRGMQATALNYAQMAQNGFGDLRDFLVGAGNNARQTLRYDQDLRGPDHQSPAPITGLSDYSRLQKPAQAQTTAYQLMPGLDSNAYTATSPYFTDLLSNTNGALNSVSLGSPNNSGFYVTNLDAGISSGNVPAIFTQDKLVVDGNTVTTKAT